MFSCAPAVQPLVVLNSDAAACLQSENVCVVAVPHFLSAESTVSAADLSADRKSVV